jgi:hypothetical protein
MTRLLTASHNRMALAAIASNTGWISVFEFEMTRNISEVAVCCSNDSFNARVSRATLVSLPAADELPGRTAFEVTLLLRAAAFRPCALGDLPPALDRRRILPPLGSGQRIVARSE